MKKITDSKETIILDPETDAAKGQKVERYDLIPVYPLMEVARHYGIGVVKYGHRNWEKGYQWSLSYAAMQRHANQFWSGEDYDSDSGTHHLAAVVFHALALMEYGMTNVDKDDRPKPGI
jgi:hypothetical protein